jgi:acetyl/propionyl-CoA carboxylase alpha subunit
MAKLVVWGENREEAIERTIRALREYRISGVNTTIGFACSVMRSMRFRMGDYATDFIETEFPDRVFECAVEEQATKAAIAALIFEHLNRQKVSLTFRKGPEGSGGWVQYYRNEGIKRLHRI